MIKRIKKEAVDAPMMMLFSIIALILSITSIILSSILWKQDSAIEIPGDDVSLEEIVEEEIVEDENGLGPCPICHFHKGNVYPVRDRWGVECKHCYFEMEFFDSKEKAIEVWNKAGAK